MLPLSVEVRIYPDCPTVTNVLLSKVSPLKFFDVPEVLLSQVVPLSVDVRMVPELPTATKVLFP